ncbi:MAG: late competence development ComFB family protein [Leptolyngbyaceae bacterium]|nr:late competence development ComFB family protein [Leptolyngbyaceae bacterium]
MRSPDQTLIYRNAMESLVAEEVDKQFLQVPPRLVKYLVKQEVAAFALNRLPSLYATSEKGWRQQVIRGRRDYKAQVTDAVRQGLVAVQRDPLRVEAPLNLPDQDEAIAALKKLKVLLQYEELSWRNVADAVEKALVSTAKGHITWKTREKFEVNDHWDQASYNH